MLLLHIASGTVGVLSGFVAVFLRKGSREHGLAGLVFVVSMLSLSASGTYMATMKHQPGNILGGTLTFYLVATAWMTARRRDGRTNLADFALHLVALAIAAFDLVFGLEASRSSTGMLYAIPAGPYFFLGSVALLAAIGDVRMVVRRGISGTARIARHLWRMCFALAIAALSIFLARPYLFPKIMQETGALYFLSFLPLLLMIYWLIRVRFAKAWKKISKEKPVELVHA
jgi:hypothetical protein